MDKNKVAVISTGNGGQTMAAYFASKGYRVALYAREPERRDMFRSNVFYLSGKVNARARVELISCEMREVIEDAALIMVTTPAQYHQAVAVSMAEHLKDGQCVVLNPGRTFGTYFFESCLKENGCTANVILAETESFAFACRCDQIGFPVIHSIKKKMPVAAHRREDIDTVLGLLQPALPEIVPAKNILQTGLNNLGVVFHPIPTLMNLTRMEQCQVFRHYLDGITPMVAGILERLDAERVALAEAVGVEVTPAFDWLQMRYGAEGNTLYERIQSTDAYQEILAPSDIYTRYVFEDVPTGFVPMWSLGKALGLQMPVFREVIAWASMIYETDFIQKGRNEEKIDFEALLREQLG